jgi:hypothetical protein
LKINLFWTLTKPVERIVAWLKVKEHSLVLQNKFLRQSFEAAARLSDFTIVCTPHTVPSAKSIQKNMIKYEGLFITLMKI